MNAHEVKKLVKKIETFEDTLKTDILNVNPKVRPGFEVSRRTAQDGIDGLIKDYSVHVTESIGAIFVLGDPVNVLEFAGLAKENAEKVIVVDATAFYRELAQPAEEALGQSRMFGINQFTHIISGLRNAAIDLDLIGTIPSINIKEDKIVKNFDETVSHVRSLVRGGPGDEMNFLYLQKQIVEEALKLRYTGSMVPVVVIGALPEEKAYMEARFNTTIDIFAKEEQDADFVIDTFKALNNKFRKTQSQTRKGDK